MTREQFIKLVSDEQEALRGFLLVLCCGNKDDADDIAQDALVKAYIASVGYQNKGSFRSWLFNPSLTFAYPFFLLSSTLRFSFAALCTTNYSRF